MPVSGSWEANGIVESLLVIIGIGRCWLTRKKQAGETQHIVAAAGLHGLGRGEVAGEFVNGEEMLVVRIAPGHKGAHAGDGFPEEFGGRVIVRFAGQLIEPLEAHDFRNLRV